MERWDIVTHGRDSETSAVSAARMFPRRQRRRRRRGRVKTKVVHDFAQQEGWPTVRLMARYARGPVGYASSRNPILQIFVLTLRHGAQGWPKRDVVTQQTDSETSAVSAARIILRRQRRRRRRGCVQIRQRKVGAQKEV